MTRSSPSRNTTANLPESVHYLLNMYALAAGATGVGALALAQTTEAKIVYTPTHTAIHRGFPGTLQLDLNHDGNSDFKFENWWNSATDGGPEGFLSVFPSGTNGIRGYSTGNNFVFFASALRAGQTIGPKQRFISPRQNDWMWRASIGWGQWDDVNNRYVGLRFTIKGETHYGWARLNVHSNPQNYKINAVLTGYAYETIPNKPIIAGKTKGPDVITVQPGTVSDSLGGLALGRK